MTVSTSQSKHRTFQHFVSENRAEVVEMKRISEAKALRASEVILLDNCNPKWLVTIETVKI